MNYKNDGSYNHTLLAKGVTRLAGEQEVKLIKHDNLIRVCKCVCRGNCSELTASLAINLFAVLQDKDFITFEEEHPELLESIVNRVNSEPPLFKKDAYSGASEFIITLQSTILPELTSGYIFMLVLTLNYLLEVGLIVGELSETDAAKFRVLIESGDKKKLSNLIKKITTSI